MKNYINFLFLFFTITSQSINPKKEYVSLPTDFEMDYVEENLDFGNVKICSWIVNHIDYKDRDTIILVYGDFGNMSYYLSYINYFYQLGYNVISFDYRGFGKSSDFIIDKDHLYYDEFSLDLENVVNYFKGKKEYKKIGLVSLSMGTLITTLINNTDKLDFILAEGCVYDSKIIQSRLMDIKGKIVKLPTSSKNIPNQWKKINTKIILLVGSDDEITTYQDALRIKNQNSNKREILKYSGGHLSFLKDYNITSHTEKLKKYIDEQ